ncbi:uncharacterized protein B0H18DRAFT_870421 [Fomitopsis serialis]|uniref:uncharacterized protein n=1 Tax=Fomitopsis serialis TaxID=139415 RepID=UPI0020077B4D|nr:uncharacterized protein B0H18DRAFT_870421 [Neoantrodia serialis]KAH9933908.1 hypothetical protein B0H18DRAFT_870421 [Neoantrodia serialis]
MASQASGETKGASSKCRLAEIVQYKCDIEVGKRGEPQVHCWPVPRIFRICPGRPAVELTRFVEMNMSTGEVHLPPEARYACLPKLPKGKPWRDIVHYDEKVAELTGEKA